MTKALAMARGLVVLDENVAHLKDALQKRNIKVVSVPAGTKDPEIKEGLISGRIFLTANSKDFIDDISSLECGLISVDNVAEMPAAGVVKMVSDTIISLSLWSKKSFVCVLYKNKKPEYKEMRD